MAELEPGSVVWVDLDPGSRREQGGRCPFLVLAGADYLEIVKASVVGLPVTTVDRTWPNHVRLHGPTGLGRASWAMTEQSRPISRSLIRSVSGSVTPATLAVARRWVGELLETIWAFEGFKGRSRMPLCSHPARRSGAGHRERAQRHTVGVAVLVDGVLSEQALERLVDEPTFSAAEDAVAYIVGLRVQRRRASGSVQARRIYEVSLEWDPTGVITGSCGCRTSLEDGPCHHVVALGLAVLDSVSAQPEPANTSDPVSAYLASLSREDLVALVLELSDTSPEGTRLVETRAALATGDDTRVSKELVAAVDAAANRRGFIDYRRSFAVARDVNGVLDELEHLLDKGASDLAAPALRRALVTTQRLTLSGDDSSGVLGDACSRAAHLYARACREGQPDRVALARWLVKFRVETPGWPDLPLADFVPAFDEASLAAYRSGLAAAVRQLDADRGTGSSAAEGADASQTKTTGSRRRGKAKEVSPFEVQRMRLELADLDGDVDLAVEILAEGREGRWSTREFAGLEQPAWGDIVARLHAAGRDEDVLTWTDRAVREGGISVDEGNAFWLAPLDVAETYLAHDRSSDALELLRQAFRRRPGRKALDRLAMIADRLGCAPEERAWAMDEARRRAQEPGGDGSILVEIALGDDDYDAAWAAADEFGAGHQAERLAAATAETHPLRAAGVHRAKLEGELRYADTRLYPQVAERLVALGELYARAGRADEFVELVRSVRGEYRRRPSLIAALDRKKLPV